MSLTHSFIKKLKTLFINNPIITISNMSSLVAALDSFTPVRHGENGHTELDWSNDIQERIVQFDFQCVRTDSVGIDKLSIILVSLLCDLSVRQTDDNKESSRIDMIKILYKIIARTRDIEAGKGEYTLSYMMLYLWYSHYPMIADAAFTLFVIEPNRISKFINKIAYGIDSFDFLPQVPYGSWKDMKYFCNYIRDKSGDVNHPMIINCIRLVNTQLMEDKLLYESTDPNNINVTLSLVSKWIPRESSAKFGWIFHRLAIAFYPEFMSTANNPTVTSSSTKAEKKCKTHYRILCAMLNRHLDTVQIKQTSKNWAAIDHSKTTSITLSKQRRAFMNLTKNGSADSTRSEDPDRIQCAENLKEYLMSLHTAGKELKGKNVGLHTFTHQAYSMIYSKNQKEIDMLNSQWRDNCNRKNANGLGPMIAIVDTSGSMEGDPMNAAIALGCRVAEKSILGKRVMTFSADPCWINLQGCDNFVDMVSTIRQSNSCAGLNTDFYKALDLILNAIEENMIPPEDVENMILAIFSDMQIDDNLSCMNGGSYSPDDSQKHAARGKWSTLYKQIKQKYNDVGMRLYGKPMNPPHILFWNLRNTNGFPCLSSEANCSMMSGFDPTILNMFCELGMDALRGLTPYGSLIKQLDNERYLPMECIIQANKCLL
jgi:hypothetical protein